MGTNHNILSSIVGKGGGEATLTKALDNANEEMIKLDPKGAKKAK